MQILPILQIIVAVVIVVLIILQERGGGISGIFGGGGGQVYQTRRGIEKIIFIATIVCIVIFIALALSAFYF